MRLPVHTFFLIIVYCAGVLLPTVDVSAQSPAKKSVARAGSYTRTDSLQIARLLQQSDKQYDLNLDSSLYYAQRSVDLVRRVPSTQLQAKAYVKLGSVLFKRADFSKSLAAFQYVERLSQSRRPDSTLLRARIFMATLARTKGDYSEGLRLALAALKLYEKEPTHYGREVGTLFTELGVMYDYPQDYPKALTFHQRRVRFSRQGGTKREQALALSNLGYIYLRINDYARARQALRQAFLIARAINNSDLVSNTLESLGEIAFHQKKYNQSIRYYRAAIRLANRSSSLEYLGIAYTKLAQAYAATGQYALADRYIHRSVRPLKLIQSAYHLQAALIIESELLERTNRFQEALLVTRQAHLLGDSLAGAEKQKTIAQLQARYDMNRKQQQIDTLHKNLLIQRQATQATILELKLARQQELFFLVVALLLGLLLAVGFISYRRQRRVSTLLKQQKDELAQQALEMAGLNKTKDKLLSVIGHDLRAPLGRMKYVLTQLHDEAPPASELQQSLAELDNQTDHVLALLTNLLDWSYHQMKGFRFTRQSTDLFDIITNIVSQSALHLKQKRIQLINRVARQTLVQTDKYQLACIVRNLVNNAIKFSTEEGIIRLYVSRDASGTQLFIQDTGIGMSEDQLSRLLTNPDIYAGTKGEPGTGLGLQLCSELIANLSGTMHITSHPDKGTTVRISLPS